MKVFVTKYALTKGIIEAEAELCDVGGGRMIEVTGGGVRPYYVHKPHWFTSEQEALGRALQMADRKLKVSAKQTDKLQERAMAWRNRLTAVVLSPNTGESNHDHERDVHD